MHNKHEPKAIEFRIIRQILSGNVHDQAHYIEHAQSLVIPYLVIARDNYKLQSMASRSRVRPTSFLSSSSESEPDDVSELDCRSGSSPLPQSHSTPRSVSSRQSQRSASVSDRTATPSHDSIERDSPNGLSLSPRSFSIADFDDTSTASNSFVSNPSQQTIMTLIRETNTLVKGFNNKLIELERKVQEITAKEPHSSTVVATRAKERKTVVTDEIRVSCFV